MDSAAAERAVRELRAAGRLAEAARLVGQLGPYGVEDGPDGTTSLGAAVLEALGDQLAAAADAAYRDAADEQRSFAAAATSGKCVQIPAGASSGGSARAFQHLLTRTRGPSSGSTRRKH
jgi:hypothetical protein